MNMSVRASCLLVAGGMLMAAPQMALGQTAFERLIETTKTEVANLGGVLDIALDWTDSDAGPVMEEFKLAFPFINTINYTRETGIGPFGQYLMMIQQGDPPLYDFMHVASEFEQQYMDSGAFIKPLFEYGELNDSLPADWPKLHPAAMDPSGYFLSTTGNARGNIWNPDLVPAGQEPDTWAACTDPKLRGQVVMDARNKLQAFQFDEGGERARHIQWLQDMKANDVVLIRGQGSIVRKIAAGEFPVACGINYHTAWRSIERDNVTTIKFTFAESVPLELGTRLYIPKWSRTPATAQLFALWAATAGQSALGKYAYRGFTWNERAHKYEQAKGKNVVLCGADCALKWEEINQEYQVLLDIPAAGN